MLIGLANLQRLSSGSTLSKASYMAHTNSIIMKGVSGQIGKDVVFKQYGDKTVVTKYPNMERRKLTIRQLQVNENMENANYYAKAIIADGQLRMEAQSRLNVTRNKLYTSLIKEYFKNHPPSAVNMDWYHKRIAEKKKASAKKR